MLAKNLFLCMILFLSSCSSSGKKEHIIAKIPEASGICFYHTTKTLYTVSDEGSAYELTTSGHILRSTHLGDYDLEGITCDEKHQRLLLAVEGKDNILILDQKYLRIQKEINVARTFKNEKLLIKDKKRGLEGITMNNDTIYLSNQSHHKYPHKDPSIIVTVKDLRHTKTPILSRIDPRRIDISGLQYHQGFLYMISDTNDKVYRYNFSKHKIDKQAKLPKFAQEGITFDSDGYIYFADDKGKILKYKREEIGI